MPSRLEEFTDYVKQHEVEDTVMKAVKNLVKEGMPSNPLTTIANYLIEIESKKAVIVTQSAEAKKLMAERGWDKGWVVFGAGPSEATVKVLTRPRMHLNMTNR